MENNSPEKQVFWFSFINYIGVAIGALSTLFIYPRNPEFLGTIRTVESYAQLLYPMILLGAAQSLVHFYPTLDSTDRNRLFLYSVYSLVIQAILLPGGFFVLCSLLDYKPPFWIGLSLPLAFFIAVNEVFKRQALNENKVALPSFFEKILPKIALPIIFIAIAYNYTDSRRGVLFFMITYLLIGIFTGIYAIQKSKAHWDSGFKKVFERIPRKEYFRYSLFAFSGSIGSLLAFRIDTIMLNLMGYSMSEIGIYNIGVLLAATLAIPAMGIFTVHTPLISKLVKENKLKELDTVYKKNAKILFFLGFLLYGCVWLGIRDFFTILPQRENLLLSVPVMLVLGIGGVVNMGTGFNSEIISYSKYYRFNIIAIGLLVGLNIGLNLLFAQTFELGSLGVAYATLVSFVVFNISKLIYIKNKLGLLPFDKNYMRLLFLMIATLIGVYLLFPSDGSFLRVIIRLSIYSGLSLFWAYQLGLVAYLKKH